MNRPRLIPFDAADYLQSEENMALYLDAVLEDGSAEEIAAAAGDIARARSRAAQEGATCPWELRETCTNNSMRWKDGTFLPRLPLYLPSCLYRPSGKADSFLPVGILHELGSSGLEPRDRKIYNAAMYIIRFGGSMLVSKWGNSLAIRLPSSVVEAMELKEGDDIAIEVAGPRTFAVTRKPDARALLAKLRKFRGRLPEDFRFDRLEANERR